MKTEIVTDPKKLESVFRIRFEIFAVRDKEAPPALYPDGLLKDSIDDTAVHLGCYEDGELLGFLSVVIKRISSHLPIEQQHNITCEPDSAEIMRLVIDEKKISPNDIAKRGRILELLFRDVGNICIKNNVSFLYLVSTKKVEKLYKRLGFEKIGDYRLYKNISLECPMKLSIENVRLFENNI